MNLEAASSVDEIAPALGWCEPKTRVRGLDLGGEGCVEGREGSSPGTHPAFGHRYGGEASGRKENRYYDPAIGRYLQPDPMNHATAVRRQVMATTYTAAATQSLPLPQDGSSAPSQIGPIPPDAEVDVNVVVAHDQASAAMLRDDQIRHYYPYAYAENNPLAFSDPTGLAPGLVIPYDPTCVPICWKQAERMQGVCPPLHVCGVFYWQSRLASGRKTGKPAWVCDCLVLCGGLGGHPKN